jgi:hypothetical protein
LFEIFLFRPLNSSQKDFKLAAKLIGYFNGKPGVVIGDKSGTTPKFSDLVQYNIVSSNGKYNLAKLISRNTGIRSPNISGIPSLVRPTPGGFTLLPER